MADSPSSAIVDLDLRGRAVVRLVGAGPAEMRTVRRQLGSLPAMAQATAPGAAGTPSPAETAAAAPPPDRGSAGASARMPRPSATGSS